MRGTARRRAVRINSERLQSSSVTARFIHLSKSSSTRKVLGTSFLGIFSSWKTFLLRGLIEHDNEGRKSADPSRFRRVSMDKRPQSFPLILSGALRPEPARSGSQFLCNRHPDPRRSSFPAYYLRYSRIGDFKLTCYFPCYYPVRNHFNFDFLLVAYIFHNHDRHNKPKTLSMSRRKCIKK